MMKRWRPFPVLSMVLLLFWLLLNESIAPSDILIGAALGFFVPLLAKPLLPDGYPKLNKLFTLLRLLGMALVEIVRSCLKVSWLIFSSRRHNLNSQFITIPLDMRNQYGLALLSCLINSTPGTVWVEILPGRHELVLHIFDLEDAQCWVHIIKRRYEQPLMEIFEKETQKL